MTHDKKHVLEVQDSRRSAMQRRTFLGLAAATTAALLGACNQMGTLTDAGDAGATDGAVEGGFDLPTRGGAPDTEEGRFIAAFCDTAIPGRHRDPTNIPGAIDVGVPGAFFDPELPAMRLVPALKSLMDNISIRRNAGRVFAALTVGERDATLLAAVAQVEILNFAIQLVRLVYYSDPTVARQLGYPGANTGYLTDPTFSFNRPMSTEQTTDGNLP